MRIVIIGNGVAGVEAALAVRAAEPAWDITVISEESDHFFSRTALMWVASGQLSHRCIEPYERDLYARMRLRRVRARAVGLDTDPRRVRLAGGLKVPYDRLLIACGSKPRPAPWPGADLTGVGHFVTMQDLEWLEAEVHGGPSRAGRPPRPDAHLAATAAGSPYAPRPVARHGGHEAAAVIGGGLIGIEAVETFVAAGLRTTFFVREEFFWPMVLDRRESTWIAERMREHGVDVRLDEKVEALLGEERLDALRTDRGEQPCDLCVVAIGVVPNTDWLRDGDGGSPIELDAGGGIVVDAGLATSAEGVFAAGDCASVRWFDGSARPEQLWYTARDQGRVAGRRLLGEDAGYERGTWYNSAKLMDIEYTTAGLVNMDVEDERSWFYEERDEVRSTTRIVTSGEKVVGFNLLGRRWDHSILCRWIEEGRSLDVVLDRLEEARFDTEFVPPLVIPESARAQPPRAPSATADGHEHVVPY